MKIVLELPISRSGGYLVQIAVPEGMQSVLLRLRSQSPKTWRSRTGSPDRACPPELHASRVPAFLTEYSARYISAKRKQYSVPFKALVRLYQRRFCN